MSIFSLDIALFQKDIERFLGSSCNLLKKHKKCEKIDAFRSYIKSNYSCTDSIQGEIFIEDELLEIYLETNANPLDYYYFDDNPISNKTKMMQILRTLQESPLKPMFTQGIPNGKKFKSLRNNIQPFLFEFIYNFLGMKLSQACGLTYGLRTPKPWTAVYPVRTYPLVGNLCITTLPDESHYGMVCER